MRDDYVQVPSQSRVSISIYVDAIPTKDYSCEGCHFNSILDCEPMIDYLESLGMQNCGSPCIYVLSSVGLLFP